MQKYVFTHSFIHSNIMNIIIYLFFGVPFDYFVFSRNNKIFYQIT